MARWYRRTAPFGLVAAAMAVLLWPVFAPAQTPTFISLPTPGADATAVAAGPDGNLWVAEFLGNNIAQVTPAGRVTEFPIPTPASQPNGITPGPDGNLWFTEQGGAKIGRITPTGTITEYAIPSGHGAGPITTGPDGNLWFGEPTGNMVGRITTAGVVTEFALPAESGPGGPTGIASGSDGALWVTLPGLNSIGRITTDGATINLFPIPTASSGAQGIATGSDGNLYFTESNANQIGQASPFGTVSEYPLAAGTGPFGIAPGPMGTMWFTALGGNALYQMILPLPQPLGPAGASPPTFTSFPLPKSCGPNAITQAIEDMFFSCADTVLNSLGEMPPPADVTLTINMLGSLGGRVTSIPKGINCLSGTHLPGQDESCQATFPSGQVVVLAPSNFPGTAYFAGWNLPPATPISDCVGTTNCQFILTADTTVSATFDPAPVTRQLSVTLAGLNLMVVNANGPLAILCSSFVDFRVPACTAEFPPNTVVTLAAAADRHGAGVVFAGWSGGGCAGTGNCIIVLTEDTEVTALVGPASPGGSIPVNAAAATLPIDRDVYLGSSVLAKGQAAPAAGGGTATATIFGTMINPLPVPATHCAVQPSPLANLPGSFSYQTTDPATNAPTGTANTPVDIPAGQAQSFVLAFSPTLPFGPIDVKLIFSCANLLAAPSVSGLDTVRLAASATPVPDVIALGATATNDQVLHITGSTGSAAFAVATVNLGAADSITVAADTGGATLPLTLNLCQTDPSTGACVSAIGPSVTTTIAAGATPTFSVFVSALDTVTFDPTDNRIFVSFFDQAGLPRGGTSVAVETQ